MRKLFMKVCLGIYNTKTFLDRRQKMYFNVIDNNYFKTPTTIFKLNLLDINRCDQNKKLFPVIQLTYVNTTS